MDCGKNIGKCLFFIFNGVFWIVGICFLAIGIATLAPGKIHDIISQMGETQMRTAGIVLVVVGSVSFFVGFAGCCGAIKDSKFLLGSYVMFLSVILILEMATGVFVLVEHGKIREYLYKKFNAIPDVKKDSKNSASLQTIQSVLHCCGYTNGCEDWDKHVAYGCTCKKADGKNCKVIDTKVCLNGDHPGKPMYTTSCYNKTADYLEHHMSLVGGAILGVGLAEILGLVLAIILCRTVATKDYEAY